MMSLHAMVIDHRGKNHNGNQEGGKVDELGSHESGLRTATS